MARYCEASELATYGIRAEALRSISEPEQLSAIDAASDEIDGYLGSRYKLPLVAWETDLRMHCARLAIYTLMFVRGFNSSRAGDEQLEKLRDGTIRWLTHISNGTVVPRVSDASAGQPGTISGGVKVASFASRGYATHSDDEPGGAFTGRRR
jgi:phage gp36-like protein